MAGADKSIEVQSRRPDVYRRRFVARGKGDQQGRGPVTTN